ncbi:hypothetical protein GCK72_014171 [Caenorhabditis remanei]|uniref:PAN-3 domain-containing protein n=1 Tax=Caenorhabditis remanei TaxID=31234 RepID=A0A6A5GTA0_CAERE|nr:hypothetical protein GCK72_014171 [Caenorhabditis remanei]KAF1757715.1 hypothetical protein GCK72_014171 [Caenorhabditis remanei]
MMVVWGEPDSVESTIKNSSISWDSCIELCLLSQECIMAWQSTGTCYIYNYYAITSVSQTTSEYGSVVAWKGSIFVDYDPSDWPMYIDYNIYLDGNKWKMSYSVNRSCSGEFQDIITHQDGSAMCVTNWYSSDDGDFSFDRGIELCRENTAMLATLIYPEDFAWFQNDVLTNLRSKLFEPDSYARFDGKRKVSCQATPSAPECIGVEGFDFINTPVPTFEHYNWVTNSSAQHTPDDNCLVVVFEEDEPPKVDVRGCSDTTTPLKSRLVFCSNVAWTLDAVDYD